MRILIVDDQRELLEFVGEALRREGFLVVGASTSEQARAVLAAQAIDLMVLDLGLPDASGVDLCVQLRQEGLDLPILVLTAQSAVASRVQSLDAGADDYLTKPFALAELRARVRALLRRAKGRPPLRYGWQGVSLDFTGRLALNRGVEAPITGREWAILEVLAATPGSVVSRQRLLDHAWPDGNEGSAASLEVLISRIRHKLGEDVVRTVRGKGYALAALAEGGDDEASADEAKR